MMLCFIVEISTAILQPCKEAKPGFYLVLTSLVKSIAVS